MKGDESLFLYDAKQLDYKYYGSPSSNRANNNCSFTTELGLICALCMIKRIMLERVCQLGESGSNVKATLYINKILYV